MPVVNKSATVMRYARKYTAFRITQTTTNDGLVNNSEEELTLLANIQPVSPYRQLKLVSIWDSYKNHNFLAIFSTQQLLLNDEVAWGQFGERYKVISSFEFFEYGYTEYIAVSLRSMA